jgi:flagellar motor switch protein FliN/FliY
MTRPDDPMNPLKSELPLSPGGDGHMPPPSPRPVDSLGFVMDVPIEVTVEIGRRSMKISDILRLGPGSVLELDKVSGEPLDIYVNGRLIARGEAVVVGDHYGVRLTEVLVVDESATRGRGNE